MITEEGMDERFFEDDASDSTWEEDEGDEEEDDNEWQGIETAGSLDFDDDSDWDEEEDVDEDEEVISQWQEGGSVSRIEDGPDQSVPQGTAGDSDTADFNYENDNDGDVDFEWNEVGDSATSADDDESHSTDVSQSRIEM